MNKIIYKKIFWMNIISSVFSLLIFIIFFGINIDYVEAKLWMKLFNIHLLITPILSSISFYKNDTQTLCLISFLSNIIILMAIFAFILMSVLHYSADSIIFLVIWSIPFAVNVKYLNELKKIR